MTVAVGPKSSFAPRKNASSLDCCRCLSLRTFFRGAKDDFLRPGGHRTVLSGKPNTWAAARLLPKVLKFLNVQTTFLSRVTSINCGLPGAAWQLQTIRLPLGSACSVVTQAGVILGNSF